LGRNCPHLTVFVSAVRHIHEGSRDNRENCRSIEKIFIGLSYSFLAEKQNFDDNSHHEIVLFGKNKKEN